MNVKQSIRNLLLSFGLKLQTVSVSPATHNVKSGADPISDAVLDRIFALYATMGPFYNDSIRPELKIAGAWRAHLLATRTKQLDLIEKGDREGYKLLLIRLFKSELVAGLWTHGYYSETLRNLSEDFFADLHRFELETGRSPDSLICDSNHPSDWGYKLNKNAAGVIKYCDPDHGRQADRILLASDLLEDEDKSPLVVADLGSGYGGAVKYLAKWARTPLVVCLFDIPLNLTTAYSYLSHQLKGSARIKLITSAADIRQITLQNNFSLPELVLIPTALVEEGVMALKPRVLHNAHSFSEMDYSTVEYYLNTFIANDVQVIVETNTGERGATNYGGHREINSMEIRDILLQRLRRVAGFKEEATRYVTSVYLRT